MGDASGALSVLRSPLMSNLTCEVAVVGGGGGGIGAALAAARLGLDVLLQIDLKVIRYF